MKIAFAVYQANSSLFGIADLLGKSDGLSFDVVARGEADAVDDIAACEFAFDVTNTIDIPWPMTARQYGLTDVVEARSTSAGDLVRLQDYRGVRFYQCALIGWERYDGPVATFGVTSRERT